LCDRLREAQTGNQAAKDEIFSFLRLRFLGIAQYRLPEAAEDIVHDALMVVHGRFSEFSTLEGLIAFTNQVLRNKIGNAYQESYRRVRSELKDTAGNGSHIYSEVQGEELERIVRESIEMLGSKRPDCGKILACLYEGLEATEISRKLGIPKSRLKVRTFRCREALRELLANEYGLSW
jgi:RNA polymerase sigma factor (sigma-70 family)